MKIFAASSSSSILKDKKAYLTGLAFENYVYLKIKDKNPVYVLENKLEIDFFLDNKVLVEVKFETDMSGKQKEFYDKFEAEQKLIIKGYNDIVNLENILKN